MSNPSKSKGTAAETAAVKWFRANGFGAADRQPLRGNRDAGDIALCPGIILEVKAHKLPTGYPTAGQLTEWMRQTVEEILAARAQLGFLIVKRCGTTDVGRWMAYTDAWTVADLVYQDGPNDVRLSSSVPVCLAVADLAMLLRAAGWGDGLFGVEVG
ncbi:MAG: hypothetical protein ACRCYU_08480 [Nocardioides sp.]